jgi:hypothetical protein
MLETDMRFFRRHRSSSWLAIFALSVQLVLAFGHVHLHAPKQSLGASLLDTCGIVTKSPCPAPNGDNDAHCAICWTVSIAGAVVVPAPIIIDPPPLEAAAVAPPLSVAALSGSELIHARARAPPLA